MATQANLDLVQELYVAYYGRPADTAGQEYWAERVEAEGEGAILNAFGDSEEFQEAFGDLSNEELVNNLYQQLFSRDAEEEGQSYWVGVLESGEKTLAEIAVTIKNAAQNDDKTVLEAKVAAAAEYTEANGGETYDVEAAKAAVAEAGSDIADAAELTEALTDLSDAQDALAEKLASLEIDTNADGEIDVEAGDAEIADVNNSRDAFETNVDTKLAAISASIDAGDFSNAGDNTKDGLIADGRAAATKAIEEAEKAIATAEAEVEDGVLTALASVESRATALETATDAANAADVAENGELAKLNEVNTGVFAVDGGSLTLDTVEVAALSEEGKWEVADNAELSNVTGFDTYLASLQAETDAAAAKVSAETALDNAILEVIQLEQQDDALTTGDIDVETVKSVTAEGETTVTVDLTSDAPNAQAVVAARGTLEIEQQELADLNDAIADYEAAVELVDEVEDLDDAVTEAREAIENSEEDGGLGVTLLEADESFTAEDDVYLFSTEASADQSLAGFGADGEDKIYVGDSFTQVTLAEDADLGGEQGDATTLEVFFQQVGADTVLSFEEKAFAGSGSTEADLAQVTLTGVNAEDLSLDNGYITVA